MKCPVCRKEAMGDVCSCGTPLAAYAHVYYMPDYLYNTALSLYQRKEYRQAAEKLAGVHVLKPSDGEALKLHSVCLYETGDVEGALEKAAMAIELLPQDEGLQAWFEELVDVAEDAKLLAGLRLNQSLAAFIDVAVQERLQKTQA